MHYGEVRGKTIEDYIRDLSNPEMTKSGNEPDELLAIINSEKARLKEEAYRETYSLKEEVERLKLVIRGLTEYIKILERRGGK